MKMNWGNRIENAVLVMIAVLMTFFVMKGIYQPQMEKQQETIVELAKIAKYAITNDFGKTKAKDGTVNLNLDNTLDVQNNEANQTINGVDSVASEQDKRKFWQFWKRD